MRYVGCLGNLAITLFGVVMSLVGVGFILGGAYNGLMVYVAKEPTPAIQHAFTALWSTPLGAGIVVMGAWIGLEYLKSAWNAWRG